jgi:hypothetical protein
MRHHFVPKGCCRRCSRLRKSAIVAPTLDDIAVVRAQGLTLARVHPEIRRTSRSHLAVMHALGVPSFHIPPRSVVAQPQPLPPHRRAHLKGSLPRAPQGDIATLVPPGIHRRAHLMGAPPRACPRDPMPQPLPPRRRARLRGANAARWPQGSAAVSVSLGSTVASVSPRSAAACLLLGSATTRASRDGGVTVSVAKTEP